MPVVLAIETSCDETSVAIVRDSRSGTLRSRQVLSNVVSSQIDLHRQYGGVVPEMASRQHVETVNWAIAEALGQQSGYELGQRLMRWRQPARRD